jgi:hypothetical protein
MRVLSRALNDVMKQDVAISSQINQHHPALIHSLAKTMNIKRKTICLFFFFLLSKGNDNDGYT